MSGQIIFKHVTAMQRFSLAGEQELFEKYGTDDRRRTIDLFQLLARAGDEVLAAGSKEALLPALNALSAMGYQRESLKDGAVPIREVGLEDSYTGTELENFARAMQFTKDRVGDRSLVMRAVYGQPWAAIAGDCEVTMSKARSAAKAAAGVLVRGYYASALTGCGETDQVLPRIIFGLYGDKDKKIRADLERFYAHEEACDACASVRTHLSRALTLMAAVIPPRDLSAEQSAEIARGRSLGLAVAADFERLTGVEVASPPEAATASEPAAQVTPAQEDGAAFWPAEDDSDQPGERFLIDEAEFAGLGAQEADVVQPEVLAAELVEPELPEIPSASAESILASVEPAQAAGSIDTAPAVEAPAEKSGFVDPGPAPAFDLAAIEEEEMLDDNDEDGGDLDLYESMAILEDVIDPTIVVPSLIRSDEIEHEDAVADQARVDEISADREPAADLFDWSQDPELAADDEVAAGEEVDVDAISAAEPVVEEIPVAFADAESVGEADEAASEEAPEPISAMAAEGSESEVDVKTRAESMDFAERDVPVALVLDLATEGDAERIGSIPPPIVKEAPGAPRSVLEAAGAAGAVTYLSSPQPAAASTESPVSRWAQSGDEDGFDYDARDEQQSSRRKIAGVLLAVGVAFLLLAGITFDGGGSDPAPVAKAPATPAAPKAEPKKPKAKKAKRKKARKKAKQVAPAPAPQSTYVPTAAPSAPQPAPSSSSSAPIDDGSAEFLPEGRG